MAIALDHIDGPGARKLNVGGTTGRVFFSPISEFSAIGLKLELDDNAATNNVDFVNITDDHTFATGKGFIEMYITRDSGKANSKPNSERDTTGHMTVFEGMTPGADAETEANLLLAQANKNIFLIELADGKLLQLGSERFPAEIKVEWESGSNEKGYRGWKVIITAFGTSKQYYTGTLTKKP